MMLEHSLFAYVNQINKTIEIQLIAEFDIWI